MTEHFAHIKIDEPRTIDTVDGDGDALRKAGSLREPPSTFDWEEGWPRPDTERRNIPDLDWEEGRPRPDTATDGNLPIYVYTIQSLCESLGIPIDTVDGSGRGRPSSQSKPGQPSSQSKPGQPSSQSKPGGGRTSSRRRDRELLNTLNYRLYRQGLRMGRYIIGKAIPKPDEQVYVYPIAYGEPPKRGTLPPSMFLAAWLVSADGVKPRDLDIIDGWLVKALGSIDQAVPAMATMRWLTHRRLILTAWRKARCESLAKFVHRRAALVNLLLALVADGPTVSPQRLARLETIYSLIGLDPAGIHSDLHRLSTGRHLTGSEGRPRPVTPNCRLSQHRLTEMAADTAKAQAILSEVFAEEPDTQAKTSKTLENSREVSKTLDVADTTVAENPLINILAELMTHPVWSRTDFERLAQEHRQTPGALLEALNDLAYDAVGDPVAEEDAGTILIDTPTAQEILDRMKE